ncbi:hypothetical protein THERMOT_142 [Bathymodiolus thermophilus thioautotrophic gill symbiont]|nr:hypothetical protein THERMOT_142 [Bathymodiolus thermophilus thioautotrophic gill symbiont]
MAQLVKPIDIINITIKLAIFFIFSPKKVQFNDQNLHANTNDS